MNKIRLAVFLFIFSVSSGAMAAGRNSFEINYGLDMNGVLGMEANFELSNPGARPPLAIQPFYKRSSYYGFNASYEDSGIGVAGILGLRPALNTARGTNPYVGLGIISRTHRWGNGGGNWSYRHGSDLYFTAGAKFDINPQFAIDLNINDFGGLTLGGSFAF